MKHTQFIICVVLFCALLQGKSAAACNITTINLTNVQCNDNGTPTITTDDYMTFSLNPVGTNLGTGYSVTLAFSILGNNSTLPIFQLNGTPATGVSYGGPVTLRTENGSGTLPLPLNNVPFTITVSDDTNSGCSQTGTGIFPIVCSTPPPPCGITTINLTNVQCNNNGTPSITTDDYMTFSLNPVGISLGSGYSVTLVYSILGVNSTLPVLQLNNSPATGIAYGGAITLRTESGSGPLPVNLGFSVPFTITVSDDTNTGCTQTGVANFPTICSTAPVCTITVDFFGNPSACNDNGTPNDPTDDFFTQNIHASFFNRPTTGSLQIVPGGDQIGTYSIPVQNIIGNSHLFNGVKLKADGTPSIVQMNFTDDPGCIDADTGPTVQPCSAPPPPCTITVDFFGNPSACNDNGTPNDPTDDFFTQNIHASFFNRPTTGSLQIVPGGDQIGTYSIPVQNIIGNSHLFNGVKLKADGTPSIVQMNFTDNPACIDADTGPTVQPCSGAQSCEIIGFSFANIGSCNNNGTPGDPADDFFFVDVDVLFSNTYTNATLSLAGVDIVGTGTVAAPIGINLTHTFTGMKLRSTGNITNFSANILLAAISQCSLPGTGPAVNSCSSSGPACAITGVDLVNPQPCNDNGTPNDPTDDFYLADLLIAFENPPATGSLQVTGADVVNPFAFTVANVMSVGSPFPVSNKKFRADGQPTSFVVSFSGAPGCESAYLSATGIGPCSFPAPVLTCAPPVTVSCSSQVPPALPSNATETHSCPGNVTITHLSDVNSNVFCINHLTITRTYQGTDQCGSTATCSQTITINDQTPPTVTCPANLAVSCANQVPAVDLSTLGVTDNCAGNVGISRSFVSEVPSNQTCTNRLTLTRTYRGGDACGNTAICTQTITVNDQTPPSLTCPAAQTFSCASQVPVSNTSLVTGLSDNCGGSTPTVTFVSDVTSNQTCTNRLTITRTYRAADVCGNSTTCSQLITVNDQTAPALICPAAQTVSCASQVPLQNITLVTGLSDNCGGTTPVVTFVNDVTNNQTCANRFTVTRTYRATDACGNSATCSQIIMVNDQTPPVFQNPPANITVDCYLVPGPVQVSASDNCGSATVTFQGEVKTPGICPVYYILTRTWLATDVCGNTATTVQVITVTDDRAPQFIVQPKDILLECAPDNDVTFQAWLDTQGGAVAEDCSPIAFSYDDSPVAGGSYVDCGNTFQRTIRFTATDECGNVSFRDATFTVLDLTPPVFTHLPEDRSVPCSNSSDGSVELYEWLDNQAFLTVEDQCGAVELDIKLTGSESGCGNTWTKKYKFTATDDCGNVSTAYASFSVIDDKPPVITACPPDNLYLTCAAKVPPPDPSSVVATDQCGSVTVAVTDVQQWGNGCSSSPMTVNYTYTVTDDCGNKTACFQHLRVLDNSAAEINIPDTVEVICVDDIPGQYAVEAYLLALLDGPCNATKIAVLQDLGLNGNSHSYRIQGRDGCRNKAAEHIVTFVATGVCAPLCSATSEIWGSPGVNISFPPITAVIDSVTNWYGGVKAGSFGRTLTVGGSDCFAALIGSGGDCSIFAAGQNVANDNNGCQLPASMLQPDGTLRSALGANVLALQLNIWYNLRFNNRDLGVQDLKDLPACMVDFSIMKSLGNHSTWQDLLNLANEYLGAANAYPYPDGFCELLNTAIANVNVLHQNCTPVPPCNNAHKESGDRNNPATNEVSLVPNPATDMVTLWYNAFTNGPLTVRITGINGAVFLQEITVQKGNNQLELPIGHLAAGIYTVLLQQGENCIVKRLVKIQE